MDLILDTHALLWLTTGDARLSRRLVARLAEADTRSFVSAVTAWEYSDLHIRGRLPGSVALPRVQKRFHFAILELPAELWLEAERLPDIHGDPIDRMLVAHARLLGMTLATADKRMRRYPVASLW